jgi:hypothetical protein
VLIHINDADDLFKFINSCNQDLTLGGLLEIPKQTVHEEAKEPEPEPEPEKWIRLI